MRTCLRALPVYRLLAGACGLALHVLFCAVALAANTGSDGRGGAGPPQLRLVVHGTTDVSEVADLLAEFMRQNPEILVQYSKASSTELFDAAVKWAAADAPGHAP